jgi:hypothetical protein
MKSKDKLDKDRFRRDLGGLIEAYSEVARRLGILSETENPTGAVRGWCSSASCIDAFEKAGPCARPFSLGRTSTSDLAVLARRVGSVLRSS